jgi:hypothetical protein
MRRRRPTGGIHRLDPAGFGNSAGMLRQSFNQSNTFPNERYRLFSAL